VRPPVNDVVTKQEVALEGDFPPALVLHNANPVSVLPRILTEQEYQKMVDIVKWKFAPIPLMALVQEV
jgi:hypothetical protein